uniref:Uncharacterized protein n=1 Tax=Medicago truncatula TaxID=3880 RepID=I3SBM3_MEDTR|nr:unknown [Medicago truncatula]
MCKPRMKQLYIQKPRPVTEQSLSHAQSSPGSSPSSLIVELFGDSKDFNFSKSL